MTLPQLNEGEIAEKIAEGYHFIMSCLWRETGYWAHVHDANKNEEMIDEMAASLEDGKRKCEECVSGLLTEEAPVIAWEHYVPPAAREVG